MLNKPTVIEKWQKKNKYGRPGTALNANKIAIHYTGKADVEGWRTVSYFNNVVANGYKINGKYIYASSHYVIDLDGTIYQLIPTNEICYATNSANSYAIAIEVATTGDDNHYTDATYKSMVHLCAWLCQYKGLDCKTDIITHTDVVGKAYKLCPIYMVKNPHKMQQFKLDCWNLKTGKIGINDIINCTSSSYTPVATADIPKLIKIIRDVNYHSSPDFKASTVVGVAQAGEIFTVVGVIKRSDTNMYKLKSGYYITTSTKYVQKYT
ncbi:N-acetylmuramoyl-L-alanine amidase [Intestinibacter sp.]